MRRADRMFQTVQLIRGRRLSTAQWLAWRLQVSTRTVYRGVADPQAQGVPIDGEAGVGYRMRAGFDLPPLMFTTGEAQSLVAAIRPAQPWLDGPLAASAESALSKMQGVLPPATRAAAESLAVYAPPGGPDADARARLETLRLATEARSKLHPQYLDLQGQASERTVRPLGSSFSGARAEFWRAAAATLCLPWPSRPLKHRPIPVNRVVRCVQALTLSTCHVFHMGVRGAPIAPPFWWSSIRYVRLKNAAKARQQRGWECSSQTPTEKGQTRPQPARQTLAR